MYKSLQDKHTGQMCFVKYQIFVREAMYCSGAVFPMVLQLFPPCILMSTFATICPWQQGAAWDLQDANMRVCT